MGTYQRGPTRETAATETGPYSESSNTSRNNTSTASNGKFNLSADQLARGLGWFSIGLGAAELFAPRTVARIAGVDPDDNRR